VNRELLGITLGSGFHTTHPNLHTIPIAGTGIHRPVKRAVSYQKTCGNPYGHGFVLTHPALCNLVKAARTSIDMVYASRGIGMGWGETKAQGEQLTLLSSRLCPPTRPPAPSGSPCCCRHRCRCCRHSCCYCRHRHRSCCCCRHRHGCCCTVAAVAAALVSLPAAPHSLTRLFV
jgi:hypothetical protein